MFTGIVKDVGKVRRLARAGGVWRLVVNTKLAGGCQVGDSLLVAGVCLTCEDIFATTVALSLGSETLDKTTVGGLRPGSLVNLEPATGLGQPLGGHLVFGHVDSVGRVMKVERTQGTRIFWFSCPPGSPRRVIPKGSVAVDGVSLTVVEVRGAQFSVAVIPYTWENTTFRLLRVGSPVNVEYDMLARYTAMGTSSQAGLTHEKLKAWGYE